MATTKNFYQKKWEEVRVMNNLKKITVNASKSYDILVGNNLIKDIGEIISKNIYDYFHKD